MASPGSTSPARLWLLGARPRTLGVAVAPIVVGTGVAVAADAFAPMRALLCLVMMVSAQIGVNYANDYSDGIRGTDAARVGPVRLVGQGLVPAPQVKRAAFACLAVTALAGLVVVLLSGAWWLLLVGVAAIAAAWFYTGGPKPYGYLGLGEVSVFLFFGVVPVVGTAYVQILAFTAAAWASSLGVGALACAVLVCNNLRDIPTDVEHGKRTLAVRLGDRGTRVLYVALVVSAYAVVPFLAAPAGLGLTGAWLALLSAPLAITPVRILVGGAVGRALIPVLAGTGLLALVYGVALGLGLVLS